MYPLLNPIFESLLGMEIIGYLLFIVIGFLLGLIGGGGSVLGVPVLVYVLGYNAETATGYSLLIVGLSAFIGSFTYLRRREISFEAILQFGISSLATVFCVRKFLIPKMPEVFFNIGHFEVTKQIVIMIVFSCLLLFSSVTMIRKTSSARKKTLMWDEFYRMPMRVPSLIILGVVVGFLSGFVGAGGGFLIIPVLVMFARVSMKKAIGTSLCIIAINSLIGFTGNIGTINIDWRFLLIVSGLSILGIIIGSFVSKYISGKKLKPAFGYITLVIGTFIIVKEIFLK